MQIERQDGIAVLTMSAGKANAIGPAFLDALEASLDALADARALVITGQGTIFSAGLDLPSLIDLDALQMEAFIDRFSVIMLRLFELPIPVVAAVNGHAIAGGCVLALQADVRIAADGPTRMGLNETALGIGLPSSVVETLRFRVPASSLVPLALEGKLVPKREALALGLVDELVEPTALPARALERARELASIPPVAFAQAKGMLRRATADRVRAERPHDPARWTATWLSPGGQERLRAAVAKLRK